MAVAIPVHIFMHSWVERNSSNRHLLRANDLSQKHLERFSWYLISLNEPIPVVRKSAMCWLAQLGFPSKPLKREPGVLR